MLKKRKEKKKFTKSDFPLFFFFHYHYSLKTPFFSSSLSSFAKMSSASNASSKGKVSLRDEIKSVLANEKKNTSNFRQGGKGNKNKGEVKSANESFCMYEDHFVGTDGNWVLREETQGLRPCTNSKCTRKHKLKRAEVCPKGKDCPEALLTCLFLHPLDEVTKPCFYKDRCIDLKCAYRHSTSRTKEVCEDGVKCKGVMLTCFKLHDIKSITPLCRYKEKCVNYYCANRHPEDRREVCPNGAECWTHLSTVTDGQSECTYIHPGRMQRLCKYEDVCRTYGCTFIHPPGSNTDCPNGLQCQRQLLENDEDEKDPKKIRCCLKHPKHRRMGASEDGIVFYE